MKRVHKWLGLVLGIAFVISSITGLLLIYKDAWLLWQYPVLKQQSFTPSLTQTASILSQTLDRHKNLGSTISSISIHSENIQGFQVQFERDGIQYIEHLDGQISNPVLLRHVQEDLVMQVFDLHAHLFYGKTGESVLGILSFFFIAMLVSGLIVWRPTRRTWLKKLKPPRVKKLLPLTFWLHRFLGVVSMPFLLISLLTGIGMVYYGELQNALVSILNEDVKAKPVRHIECLADDMKIDFFQQLSLLDNVYPDATLVRVYPPKNNEPMRYRLKHPEEWHQNGRSYIYMNPCTNQVIYQRDARDNPTGVKLMDLIYPIHSVHVGGLIFKLLISLSSLAVLMLFVTGVFTWWRRIRPRS